MNLNMSGVKYSVVIPTFNRADFLKELLDCLVNQTYKDFEVLVCDDGSTDNTKDVVEAYTNKLDLKYLYQSNWGGPAKPRNLGVDNAAGEWILFVDSDDLWDASKVAEVHETAKENVDVIYHLFRIEGTDKVIGNYTKPWYLSLFFGFLYNGNKIVNSSLCVRKNLLLKVGRFTEDKANIAVEDFDLILKLAQINANFLSIKKVLGTYRLNEGSISKNFSKQIKKFERLLKSYVSKTPNSSAAKVKSLIDYMKGSYLKDMHRPKFAKNYLFYSFLHGTFNIKVKSFIKLGLIYFS